ncbi:MAG: GntR family transcriptional regulator, partial [Kiritimatiellae bacterium]|nr:GntR family transcriptional regulator [Kiritimatiellia bacterium]
IILVMKCREIHDKLVKDIMSGVYTKAGRLPSEASLAASFGASRMTLRAALEELRRQGLIEKRNGTGSFLTRRAFRRSGLIGLVIPDYADFEFFTAVEDEVKRHARRLGYHMELLFTQKRSREAIVLDMRRKVRKLAVARAEGVIFRPFVTESLAAANKEIVDIFRHAEVPVVLIDSDITQPPRRSDCDLVAINNISAGRQIAGHLYERGYRRIAFLMQNRSPFANANWGDRLFGLAGELALRGCEESVRQLDFSATDANALGALLRSRRKLDAIVCGNDEQAAYLMETLAVLGKHAPEDVAVVGFDDIALARSTTPPLTTISQPVKKLASTAFKSLLARIRYPNNDPREILLDAPLVVRQST